MKTLNKVFNLNKLSTLLLYTSILTFIIAFNFAHNPPGGWYQQFLPNLGGRSTVDVCFTDSLTGYLVTTYSSLILKTMNGGDNWTVIHSEVEIFKRVQFIDSLTGFVAGSVLIKTTDSGISWSSVNIPVPCEDMFALNNDTIFIVYSEGLTGGVFRTTNGGQSWDRQLNLGSQNPDHIYMFNGRIGFVSELVSGAPYTRKTTDSGLNWLVVDNRSFRDMHFVDSVTGWKAYGNNMYCTTNGGLNWTTQTLPNGGIIFSTGINEFSIINPDTIWGAGGTAFYGTGQFRSIIYRTTNRGVNWLYQIPDTAIHASTFQNLKFIDYFRGWAYWGTGGIHTLTGGDTTFTKINSQSNIVPGDYILFQNFPNPFNPSTILKYELKKSGFVELKVYDIAGRKIMELVHQSKKAGSYETVFTCNDCAAGVYFYSLEIDGVIIDTKKMILVK